MSENPLIEIERDAGAEIRPFGGLDLPDRFGDPMAECEAVRGGAGLFDLGFRSRLRATGPDRTEFLHNLLANDVAGLRPGEGCSALLLTRQSRVVTEAVVSCLDDAVDLDVDLRQLDRVVEHLERHRIADEVDLTRCDGEEWTIGVQGPAARRVLEAAGEGAIPETLWGHTELRVGGAPVRVCRSDWTGDRGFDVRLLREDAANVWEALDSAGKPLGLVPAGMFAFNVLRVEAGVPWVGLDVDESTLALESGLERSLHFQKGCYLGQEIVERQAARGHVNRKITGLRIDSTVVPRPGSIVRWEGEECGVVTSAVFAPTLGQPIALAMLKRPAFELDTRVEISSSSEVVSAIVSSLPFHRSNSSS